MVLVSNRLPVTVEQDPEGFRVEANFGGVVTALHPLLNECAATGPIVSAATDQPSDKSPTTRCNDVNSKELGSRGCRTGRTGSHCFVGRGSL